MPETGAGWHCQAAVQRCRLGPVMADQVFSHHGATSAAIRSEAQNLIDVLDLAIICLELEGDRPSGDIPFLYLGREGVLKDEYRACLPVDDWQGDDWEVYVGSIMGAGVALLRLGRTSWR